MGHTARKAASLLLWLPQSITLHSCTSGLHDLTLNQGGHRGVHARNPLFCTCVSSCPSRSAVMSALCAATWALG